MKNLRLIIVLSQFIFPCVSFGYEVETHGNISEKAAEGSILNERLKNIGLDSIDDKLSDGSFVPEKKTIKQWIREGAEREDDYISESFFRFRNHFYNPLPGAPNGGGYTYGIFTGVPSPDWGLEDASDISGQNYSYKDGREYFYKGLTAATKEDREKNLALTFRTLGDVIHLIQDAAQPQHTRNDSHGGFFLGPKSLYEIYTNDNRSKPLYSGYAPVYSDGDPAPFNLPRNLWHTSDGKGIADYSNSGFVSAGTNFDIIIYPSPVRDLSSAWDADIADLFAAVGQPVPIGPNGTPLSGKMTFLRNTVTDSYRPTLTKVNDKTSTYSIFDADLTKYNKTYTYYDFWGQAHTTNKVFTLNRFNFDSAHQFLIPRAVGYSAGLINYFFRGKLDFVPDTTDPSKYVIKNLGKEEMSGTFTLYYDDKDDKRHPVPGAEWTNLTIVAGKDSTPVYFTPPTNPAPKNEGEYMLVFKGTLGQETNAVVGHWVEDPLVVVGQSGGQAFRWTEKEGMVGLGFLPGASDSAAYGVSADGSIIVGYSGNEAFRWTAATGMVGLGFLQGSGYTKANGVSADGSVIVGQSQYYIGNNLYREAFRWTAATGMVGLGFSSDDDYSLAYSVSADGSVISGTLYDYNNNNTYNFPGYFSGYQAFRWIAATGIVSLGFSTNAGYSDGIAISANGSVIVGNFSQEAFRWTATTGMVGLGFSSGGGFTGANSVSADGSVIVGQFNDDNNYYNTFHFQAFRWTATTGMVGLGFLPGDNFSTAIDVSADGSVIVGRSGYLLFGNQYSYQAFIWGNGIMKGLGFLPGANNSFAYAVATE